MKKIKFILISFIAFFLKVNAQITLPQIVRDSMILQRDAKINIWGWASKNEKITLSFNKKKYKTKTTADGKWKILLYPMKAGGPYKMTIAGKNKIELKEILIGDVWYCSGQSNMVHQMNIHDVTYAADIASANFKEIRQFLVPTLTNLHEPKNNLLTGFWKSAVAENDDVRSFSAVAFFFARKLYQQYHIPIGIINASVGGTPIEAWISEEGLKNFQEIDNVIQKNKDTTYINYLTQKLPGNKQLIIPQDKGLTEVKEWYNIDYIPKNWKTIAVPGYWNDEGIKDLNGIVWYRKEFNVPATMIAKPAKIFLGRIVDADVVYINGKQIGTTTYQYPQRKYKIDAGILQAKKNIIVIKVTNNFGKGGFVPNKPYCIFTATDTIDLKGYWQYKVGAVFNGAYNNATNNFALNQQPTALYNAMVAPVTNYTIKGFVWYQGESNTSRATAYAQLQFAQITDWRNKWQQGNLPFLFVQLPNFMDASYLPSESQWATLREAQLKSLSVINTGMVVAIDIGEWNDIHPDNKKTVGDRLALLADKMVYGKNIVCSGPIFQSAAIEANKIIISFTNIGGGLISNDNEELREFAIAGVDKKFVWAKATIEGNKIIVYSNEVINPVYVRYAWADNPDVNFYNKEGLPASPFRTDN